ncbi:MAG: class I SAM-dependent methyltransferase [Acidimicrobiales bacterium]
MRGAVGENQAPLLGGELARLTGERPVQGVTPDSLLALHDAGYRAVTARVGEGRLLDLGCGQGFESVRLIGPRRSVVGVDYSIDAVEHAARIHAGSGLSVARTDALALCIGGGSFDYVCSSHLIEHFEQPEGHVEEMARVLKPAGRALILTPNAPADFENPFHVHLFDAKELRSLLSVYFSDVWIGGLDATDAVKADFAARRERAAKVLSLDVFDLRHRIPRSWYVAGYTRALPLAYRIMARHDTGGSSGITADDFFVTDEIDDTTLVLFAIAGDPRR